MGEWFIALIVVVAVVAYAVRTWRRVPTQPWNEPLQRLHPGVADKAEWMASESTVQRVMADYLAAHSWLGESGFLNYNSSSRQVRDYLSGSMLTEMERVLLNSTRRGRARFVGVLRAHHHITVRRFSDDGLTCLIIDRQSERRMATYDYWTRQRLHTQDLGSGAMVYKMRCDPATRRWKIDELIQQLPVGWEQLPALRMTDALPSAAGRDI